MKKSMPLTNYNRWWIQRTAFLLVFFLSANYSIAQNIAPSGTASIWTNMTSSMSNTSKVANTGINDHNTNIDVILPDVSAAGNWQAAGVVWTSSRSNITSVKYYNGNHIDDGFDNGSFTANAKLQTSSDGTSWTDVSGWTITPAYPYTAAASNQVYTFSGTALNNVRGIRVVGQVRTNNTSWSIKVKELEVILSSIAVTGVSVSPSSASIVVGSTQALTATVAPSNATNKSVNWSSSNSGVATVNSTGLVTAVAAGSATITVTTEDGNRTAASSITVIAPGGSGSNIALSAIASTWTNMTSSNANTTKVASAGINDNNMLVDVVLPDVSAAGNWQAAGLVWTTSQSGITSVKYYNGNHIDDGFDNGSFTANAKLQTSSDGTTWTDVSGWTVSPTYPYTAAASNQVYTFSGAALHTVRGIRVVGQVRTNNTSWSIKVKELEVITTSAPNVPVTGVIVSPVSASLAAGSTQLLTATVSPANATNKALSWSTSNSGVATVNSAGLVSAVAAGSATITVTTADGNRTAISSITVTGGGGSGGQYGNLLDPNATPATVALWNYLKSQYGTKMLTAGWAEDNTTEMYNCANVYPAIFGADMTSWYADRNDPMWNATWNSAINDLKNAYARGQILQVNWHWQMVSTKVNGVYGADAWGTPAGGGNRLDMTNQEWADIITPGTSLYNAMIEDVDYHVNGFLKKIVDANNVPIPIIWRPMHEIDGGWFWWTCESDPAKTAELFKIVQDRIINYHGMHNLIWVYNPAVLCAAGSWPPYGPNEVSARLQFYPGDAYCDITGIDLYDFDPVNRSTYGNHGITFRQVWNVMQGISPNKMIALCESESLPDISKAFSDPDHAPWLYAMPWYGDSYYDATSNQTVNTCSWHNLQMANPKAINAGDFAQFVNSSARIEQPTEIVSAIKGLTLFPNPVTSVVNIAFGTETGGRTSITLQDVSGKQIRSSIVQAVKGNNQFQLNLGTLKPGMYMVRVQVGAKIMVEKIIVNN